MKQKLIKIPTDVETKKNCFKHNFQTQFLEKLEDM